MRLAFPMAKSHPSRSQILGRQRAPWLCEACCSPPCQGESSPPLGVETAARPGDQVVLNMLPASSPPPPLTSLKAEGTLMDSDSSSGRGGGLWSPLCLEKMTFGTQQGELGSLGFLRGTQSASHVSHLSS